MPSRWKIIIGCAACFGLLLLPGRIVDAQEASKENKQEHCGDHPKLWRDEKGNPVRLTQKQLKKRIIHCETPMLPGSWDANGSVLVQVLIGAEGKVECAEAISGHPLVRELAEKTAKRWTFKPLMNKNEPVAVSTILTLYVSWDYEKAHRSNCGTK